ncbi:hypothetical protein [Acholeplasma granularum]|uniref:hypothetical protein n=1 Tax=Acholeplasma granularum TaxID=264635 RepID=UPI000471E832|nr:hypothetical protein [Acholeplasma granularum]
MKLFSKYLKSFIRATAIILIGINLFRLFDVLDYFNFLQPPLIALFNAIILLFYSYLDELLALFNIKMSYLFYMMLSLSIVTTFIGGLILGLYQLIPGYDSFAHFFNGGLLVFIGLFVISIFISGDKLNDLPFVFLIFIAFCFGQTIGVVWEIYEFAVDGLIGTNMQRFQELNTHIDFIGRFALKDTMKDFILNFLGGLITSIIIYLDSKKDASYLELIFAQKINEYEKSYIS